MKKLKKSVKMVYLRDLLYKTNSHASSISKQMPFNPTNVVAAPWNGALYVRLHALLPNGIAVRGHVRGRNERDERGGKAAPPMCKVRV